MSDDPTPKDDVPVVYANWFLAGPSPFELALDFGYQAPDTDGPRRAVRIVSTWEHAKLLKQVLDQIIEIRENNTGEIAEPPGIRLNVDVAAMPNEGED
jgi:Protein of unknown function (DUF3467)